MCTAVSANSCALDATSENSDLEASEPTVAVTESGVEASPDSCLSVHHQNRFVRVKGTEFVLNGHTYHYVGANFWQAMNLASRGPGGNRAQLVRELDRLRANGITNLRIAAISEGPDTEPLRSVPALVKAPGVYDRDLLDGLDFLLKEMGDRHMKAIMVLGNMWHWSGGFGQYLVWAGVADSIPYPPPHEDGDWDVYQRFCAQFYGNKTAVDFYLANVRDVVTRVNAYTRVPYSGDPAIMSWELANEPRAVDKADDYYQWIERSSNFIKSLDRNHLVTTGSEGDTGCPERSNTEYYVDHGFPNIDYGTAHVWIQNWGWYDPRTPKFNGNYEVATAKAMRYIESHAARTVLLNKPLVLEEFGIARDDNSFDPVSTVAWRDRYYAELFEHMLNLARKGMLSGTNFWAWSGESRPVAPYGLWWKPGDPFLGDPPHELQGWYGVYDTDVSTVDVIAQYSHEFSRLNRFVTC